MNGTRRSALKSNSLCRRCEGALHASILSSSFINTRLRLGYLFTLGGTVAHSVRSWILWYGRHTSGSSGQNRRWTSSPNDRSVLASKISEVSTI